jgi:hypothetical protein
VAAVSKPGVKRPFASALDQQIERAEERVPRLEQHPPEAIARQLEQLWNERNLKKCRWFQS